MTEPFSAV